MACRSQPFTFSNLWILNASVRLTMAFVTLLLPFFCSRLVRLTHLCVAPHLILTMAAMVGCFSMLFMYPT